MNMTTQLNCVATKAKLDKKAVFTSLAHLLTPEYFNQTWRLMNKRGAPGVDMETAAMFSANLQERTQQLWKQLTTGCYKAPPVRKVEIPKDNGKTRQLGIPTVSDRLLQASVARILNAIYEPLFLNCSWGYRPGRSAHGALKMLRDSLVLGKSAQYVFEADIRAYFDRVNHEWLRKMLRQKIADPVILRLIDKWLRAGIMEDGLIIARQDGVPQGGPISCILSNIYLHYVLDLWFEKRIKPICKGEAHLIRYVDDFAVCFRYLEDARRFGSSLRERFDKFHLKLAEEKTRCITFGRFARESAAKRGGRVETFDFLGFTHICGLDQRGRFALIRHPRKRSVRKFLDRVREWLRRHPHLDVYEQQKQLTAMLSGFYQYYALHHCARKLELVHMATKRYWRHFIRRQSQRSKGKWNYLNSKKWFQLPKPVTLHFNV